MIAKFTISLTGLLAFCGASMAASPVIQDPGTVEPNVVDVIVGQNVDLLIKATNEPTSYSATGLPAGFTIDPSSGVISGKFLAVGSASITASATNNDGTGNRTFTLNAYPEATDFLVPTNKLATALDTDRVQIAEFGTNLTPTWNGKGWLIANHTPGIGTGPTYVLNRRPMANNASNGLRTYIQGPAEVTFSWGCNIERGFDVFAFFVDGNFIRSITGNSFGFADSSYTLGPGLHELDWVYITDFSLGNSAGVFFDNLRVTGYPVWAKAFSLGAFNSDLDLDKEKDGNTLLEEYGLNLSPLVREFGARPQVSFDAQNRMTASINKNPTAIGVTVDIQSNPTLAPGNWSSADLDTITETTSNVTKREKTATGRNFMKVDVRAN